MIPFSQPRVVLSHPHQKPFLSYHSFHLLTHNANHLLTLLLPFPSTPTPILISRLLPTAALHPLLIHPSPPLTTTAPPSIASQALPSSRPSLPSILQIPSSLLPLLLLLLLPPPPPPLFLILPFLLPLSHPQASPLPLLRCIVQMSSNTSTTPPTPPLPLPLTMTLRAEPPGTMEKVVQRRPEKKRKKEER